MTPEKIDQLLADWRNKLDLVGQNLMDLHGLPTYQRLSGAYGFPKTQLMGITQARVTPALDAMNDLFQHFDLLLNTVNKATELRKQVSWFLGSEQKIHEIEQLLTGQSIQLPSGQTPLAQRGLLTAAETAHAIAPEKLLALMTNVFQVAKDVVVAVDDAWSRLEPTLAAAKSETFALQKLADSLGQGYMSELIIARQKIAALRTSIESDPLGVSADFDKEIQPLIAQVRTSLEQLIQQKTQIRDNLETAHQLLKKLAELNRQATETFAESKDKVVDHSRLQTPLEQDKIDALGLWLTRLESKFAEGFLNPVCIGLENWTAKVKEYLVVAENAYIANKAPLETRAELRGRLDALKVKAIARGVAEDAVLTELARESQQLLYTRPTPLDKAAELVSHYEKRVNNRS